MRLTPIKIYTYKEQVEGVWDKIVTNLYLRPYEISGVYKNPEGATILIYKGIEFATPLTVDEVLRFLDAHIERVQIIYSQN